MRTATLDAELEAITRNYDYGIVPGSATTFMIDEKEGIGRLDLTLLEGVMIVIEVGDQGYKVISYSPLYVGTIATETIQTIVGHLNQPFETMENLLMTISPMFCQQFHELLFQKLQHVSELSSTPTAGDDDLSAAMARPSSPQQQQHGSSAASNNNNNNNSSLNHSPDNSTRFDSSSIH